MANKWSLGRRAVARLAELKRRRQRRRFEELLSRTTDFEALEPREMMTVASSPAHTLPAGSGPLEVKPGPIDTGERADLVALSTDGRLTVALNNDDNRWQSIQTIDLQLGTLHGMELALIDSGPHADVVVQGHDSIYLLRGEGTGQFTLADAVSGTPGAMAPAGGGRVVFDAALLDGDFVTDVVTVAPGTDELLVFHGTGGAALGRPDRYPSGGREPVVAMIGSVIGHSFPDVVVGHADGSVTWFEGKGDGTLVTRPDLTVTGLGSVADITIGDFDTDGDQDVAVSGGSQVTLLISNDDPLPASPIANGDFSSALTGWTTEIVGHAAGSTPGTVSALGQMAQLRENESFLVSLSQTITVPASPQVISFDIESLALEGPLGGVPDAFEVSLLNDHNTSFVPTHHVGATSFFSVNPDGAMSLAPGVTFDGRRVTVDISNLTPGEKATLYFDLIGNPPGRSSVVSIDNVAITPSLLHDDTQATLALPGPFTDAAGITHGDVDGDGVLDIVVADAGADRLVVFSGDGRGGFVRSELDTSGLGAMPLSVATGQLTAMDMVDDLAVALFSSDTVISPVVADMDAPMAVVIDPDLGQPILDPVLQATLRFSEPMRDNGPTGHNSVTNTGAYSLVQTDTGTGISIQSVTYDPQNDTAVIHSDPNFLPLADGTYQLTLEGDNPTLALEDLSGNRLATATDQTFLFTVNSVGPALDSIASLIGKEGESLTLTGTFLDTGATGPFTATVDWGDDTTSAATVSFLAGLGTITSHHVYADDGMYVVGLSITDAANRTLFASTTATVGNVPPTITPAEDQTIVEDAELSLDVATFADPGFTNQSAGSAETFTATIDWGDGTPVDVSTPKVTQGGQGTFTAGTVTGAHTYAGSGDYLVTLTVIDDDNGTASATFQVAVEDINVAPSVGSIEPLSAEEGASVSLAAPFGDPSEVSGSHTAVIQWGDAATSAGTVSFDNGQGTVSGDHVYADDGNYAITVTITDGEGLSGQGTSSATIANAAPTVTAAADQAADEDTPLSLVVATFIDPGFDTVSTSETFVAEIDWGDGTLESGTTTWTTGSEGVPTRGQVAGTHSYAIPGDYVVTVSVTDDDGGSHQDTFTVTVRPTDLPPRILSAADVSGDEGQLVSFVGTFTDVGDLSSHTAFVDWGDGNTTQTTIAISGNVATAVADHAYQQDGTYAITFHVFDRSHEVTAAATATIGNLAPMIHQMTHTALTCGDTSPGHTVSLSAVFADPGTLDGHTATIDWGDGTITSGSVSGGRVTGSHPYDDGGVFVVVVTVTDDHGALHTAETKALITGAGVHGRELSVVGTHGEDQIQISPEGNRRVKLQADFLHDDLVLDISGVTEIIVFGCDDRDQIQISLDRDLPSWVDGGPGDDQIQVDQGDNFIVGGAGDDDIQTKDGDDIVLGGPGEDSIQTDQGRDILVGGDGIDDLDAGDHDDLLVGGSTSFAVDRTAWGNIAAEWTRTDAGYSARADHLHHGGGLNDPFQLTASSAGDGASDAVDGQGGRDLFYLGGQDEDDADSGEIVVLSTSQQTTGASAATKFYVVDNSAVATFRYAPDGSYAGQFSVSSHPRGATAHESGSPLWIVDKDDHVYVYDTQEDSLLGAWTAIDLDLAEGIATDGTDIWIVDDTHDTVFSYAGGAGFLSGDHEASASFALDASNTRPTGITTDGDTLWVSDKGADAVFVYDVAGMLLGSWELDRANGGSSGITLNPSGGDDLWVVDRGDDVVYHYAGATSRLHGRLDASSSFALAPANGDARGIADPTSTIAIGDVLTDQTIAVAGGINEYVFPVIGGETVFLDFQQLAGGSLTVRLLGPDGTELSSATGSVVDDLDQGPLTLLSGGNHTLEVTGPVAGTTFGFQVLPVINLGELVTGATSVAGEIDTFAFSGSASQDLFFDVVVGNQFGQSWTLTDSLGHPLFSGSMRDQEGVLLPADGLYFLTVQGVGGFTGPFQFQIHETPETIARPILLDQLVADPVEDAILVPGERNLYTFTASAGQQIFFDAIQGNRFGLTRTLTSPAGVQLLSGGYQDSAEITLNESGTYQLLVDGVGSFLESYQFYVWDSTDVGPIALPLNTAAIDHLAPQQVYVYQIDGTAGQELILDIQENEIVPATVLPAAAFTLTAPSGADVFAGEVEDRFVTPLPETGNYTLTVSQNDPADTDSRGTFAFRVQEVIAAPPGGPRDGVGTDFWLALPPASVGANQVHSLLISSEPGAQGVLHVPHLGMIETFDVPARGSIEVPLPPAAAMSLAGREVIENKALHVTTSAEVTIQVMFDGPASSDAYLAIPVDGLGTEYLVVAQQDGCPALCHDSEFTVVAVDDNTTLSITPTVSAGEFGSERPAGVPYTVSIDQGQAYRIQGGSLDLQSGLFTSLTGTEVLSDKPVFLLGGNQATRVPHGTAEAADFLVEQVFPLGAWGTRFVTSTLATRDAYTLKLTASRDGTTISVDGSVVAMLDRGEFLEQVFTGAVEVTANHPIALSQLAHSQQTDNPTNDPSRPVGDPFLMQLPPVEQFRDAYSVIVPDSRFDPNFINVVAPDIAVGTIKLNDVEIDPSEFAPVAASGYYQARLPVVPGNYRLASTLPFGVTVYGFEDFGSYAYTAGTQLAPVGRVSSLSLSPSTATLLVNNTHTVTSTVTDHSGSRLEDVLVEFTVRGAHQRRGFARTNASGLATFSYLGDTAGLDTIVASVGTKQVQGIADWIGAEPSIVVTTPPDGEPFAEGTTVVAVGQALPGPAQGRIVQVSYQLEAASGFAIPVDALDAAGNFFASVDVELGPSTLTFTATDEFGQTATAALTLEGLPANPGIDTGGLRDNALDGTVTYQSTTFNRGSRSLLASALLTNHAEAGLGPFVLAAFGRFDPLQVDLGNRDGILDGTPFINFDTELGGVLAAGATSAPAPVEFTNLARERFDFDVRLLALGNTPPRFSSAPVAEAVLGRTYQYDADAVDAEDNSLTYTLKAAPSGMTIEPDTGLVTFRPTAADQGTHPIEILVADGQGGTSKQSFQLSVISAPPNRPPRFESVPPVRIASGEDYRYRPIVVDPDKDALSFRLEAAPAGVTIDPATGEVVFLAPPDGNFGVSILADDGRGGTAVQTYLLSVGDVGASNASPLIRSTPSTAAAVGALYLYLPQATDPDGDLLSFRLLEAPLSMTIDAATGRIDYTPSPTDVGPQPMVILVEDGNGGFASQSFTIVVADLPPNLPPAITTSPSLLATQNQTYTYDVQAVDPENIGITYALTDSPAGMMIDSSRGVISWTPTVSDLGGHVVAVTAADAAGLIATQTYALEVRPPNIAPLFHSSPDLTVSAGGNHRYEVVATDADDTVSYSLISAPAGMNIGQTNGIVFWRTDLDDIGDHGITIRATDQRGLSTDQSYVLHVTPDVTEPLATVTLSDTLIDIGDTVRINVVATDDVAVQSLALEIDGVARVLDANHGVFYTATTGGLPQIIGTAIDTSGNLGAGSPNPPLRVLDPNDTEAPITEITSPATGSIVTYLTDLIGTVADDNLEFYRLQYALAGSGEYVTFFEGIGEVAAGLLGTFDPTMLVNDLYEVRLLAQDTNGRQSSSTIELSVESQAKLGNFRVEFTDLAIPLAGIPLQIHRIYDTLEANISSDFGFGWTLGLYSPAFAKRFTCRQPSAPGQDSLAPIPFGKARASISLCRTVDALALPSTRFPSQRSSGRHFFLALFPTLAYSIS